MMNFKAYIAATAIALAPVAASAATVDINFQGFGSNNAGNIASAVAAQSAFMGSSTIVGSEAFDGFTACDNNNAGSCSFSPLDTSVGQFTGVGPANSGGGSQVNPTGEVVVRSSSPNPFGRFDVVGNDGNWLDSNDMNGIHWDIPGNTGLSNITKIAFFLTDVDDVGNLNFAITTAGDAAAWNVVGSPVSGEPNGQLFLVTMLFSEGVDNLQIQMVSGTGDGFGMDGVTVAAVPLPAAGFLLIGAIGGLAALRRRRKAVA